MNLWLIFITGLTSGGVSCLAMQGGLLAGMVANQKKSELKNASSQAGRFTLDKNDWLPVTLFLVSKVFIHVVFGFMLGMLGSVIALSLGVRLTFQLFAAFFMLATAMNLLQVHPIFRYVVIQPPKFVQRLVRGSSKGESMFSPIILGLLTVFIPCGVTQAMEVNALNSGSAMVGALTMLAFTLGTVPLFAAMGIATARLSETWNKRFLKVAAYALIVMAVYGINGVLVVVNSPVTLQKIAAPVTYFFSEERFASSESTVGVENGVQRVTINAINSGYEPRYFKVAAGVPVELTVSTNETYSCAVAFTMKAFNISTFLGPTDSETFAFTPTKPGKYTYSCSMGMYTGTMEVI
jgi:sulfite exporter TauE/SafE